MVAAGAKYVALGSSFAAGPGIAPVIDAGALRSGRNYPHQLADAMSLALHDVTSSGATALELLREHQLTPAGPRPPQIEALDDATRLITITAGGNDVGYIGAVIQSWYRGQARLAGREEEWLAEQADPLVPPPQECLAAVPLAEERLRELVAAARLQAPRAVIVVVDYLTVLGLDAERAPGNPLEPAELRALRALGESLAGATARAAADGGALLASASVLSAAHGVGSAHPWVTGAVAGDPLRGEPIPFHPNVEGMTAVARLLADMLAARG